MFLGNSNKTFFDLTLHSLHHDMEISQNRYLLPEKNLTKLHLQFRCNHLILKRKRTWVGKTLIYAKFSCTRIINTSDHIVNHFLLHDSRSVLFHLNEMKEEVVPVHYRWFSNEIVWNLCSCIKLVIFLSIKHYSIIVGSSS